jgi:hypothetical protein
MPDIILLGGTSGAAIYLEFAPNHVESVTESNWMRNAILFLLSSLSLTSAAQAEPHHCHDQATNKQWEQIMWNHRGERDVEALYALRVRLCRQVDAGTISVRKDSNLRVFNELRL